MVKSKTFIKTGDELKKYDNLNFKVKIGTTTYMVYAHFNDKAQDDIYSKLKSLITR
ncbi:MAG: hypothetical protein PUF72_01460 [Clostridiales bacterium]|nr:hypothetical protein [Clostridiales bacterium]